MIYRVFISLYLLVVPTSVPVSVIVIVMARLMMARLVMARLMMGAYIMMWSCIIVMSTIMTWCIVISVAIFAIYTMAVIIVTTIEAKSISHVVARIIVMAVAMTADANGYAI